MKNDCGRGDEGGSDGGLLSTHLSELRGGGVVRRCHALVVAVHVLHGKVAVADACEEQLAERAVEAVQLVRQLVRNVDSEAADDANTDD